MNNRKIFFIYNPVSGKGTVAKHLGEILTELATKNIDVEVRPTLRAGEATEIISSKNLSEYESVLCSGGDGTLNEVVTGMMKRDDKSRIPISYIPMGSTNDFANSIGIPTDIVYATRNSAIGEPFQTDIGMLGDKPFVYVAAFGLFTALTYETKQSLKNMMGHFAYILMGAKNLKDLKGTELKIKVNDKTIEGNFLVGLITNSKTVGGINGIIDTSRMEFDDGEFEITLIMKPRFFFGINSIIASILGKKKNSRYIKRFKASEVSIEALNNEEVSWTVDGEYGGDYSNVDIKNINKAISIILPSNNLKSDEYYSIANK